MKRLSYVPAKVGSRYHAQIRELAHASGVYVIRRKSSRRVLYVGESHTGRLYDTLTRHFRKWSGPTAGYTCEASEVEVAIIRVPAPSAVAAQNGLIQRLRPHWNVNGFEDDAF